MRVAVINSGVHGGAAAVARHLATGLVSRGHQACRFVRRDAFQEQDLLEFPPPGRGERLLEKLERRSSWPPLQSGRRRVLQSRLLRTVRSFSPDVINLHNIHAFDPDPSLIQELCGLAPVVWCLHDMWPVTGGCAQSHGCTGYSRGCSEPCPRKDAYPCERIRDTGREWDRKQAALRACGERLILVPPARWLEGVIRSSGYSGPLEVVPNGIDPDRFARMDREEALLRLGLEPDRRWILLPGSPRDPNKGLPSLIRAAADLPVTAGILVVGLGRAEPESPIPIRSLDYQRDPQAMRACYAAATVVTLPSRAETFPLCLLEALACGRPVVASDVGGCREILEPSGAGVLVPPGSPEQLGRALNSMLQLPDEELREMGRKGRRWVVENYRLESQVERILALLQGQAGSREGEAA